jgi:hypothetical protein
MTMERRVKKHSKLKAALTRVLERLKTAPINVLKELISLRKKYDSGLVSKLPSVAGTFIDNSLITSVIASAVICDVESFVYDVRRRLFEAVKHAGESDVI